MNYKHLSILVSNIFLFLLSSCYDSIVGKHAAFSKKVIETYQSELKEFYLNPKTTPLKGIEIDSFKGITFFPINEEYYVIAKVTSITNGDTVIMPTSAQNTKRYLEYCYLDFTINNQKLRLTAYLSIKNENELVVHKDVELFVPFKDETNSVSSYGGGRYLDIHTKNIINDEIVLDFNKAYNPYCAYSIFYNCPIPPSANHLKIEIPAGVSYED